MCAHTHTHVFAAACTNSQGVWYREYIQPCIFLKCLAGFSPLYQIGSIFMRNREIEAINLLIQASLVSMCCTCFRSLPRNRALAVSSLSSVSLSNRIDLSNLFSTRPVSLPECSLFYFHANTYTHTHTCAHIHIHYNTYSVFYM